MLEDHGLRVDLLFDLHFWLEEVLVYTYMYLLRGRLHNSKCVGGTCQNFWREFCEESRLTKCPECQPFFEEENGGEETAFFVVVFVSWALSKHYSDAHLSNMRQNIVRAQALTSREKIVHYWYSAITPILQEFTASNRDTLEENNIWTEASITSLIWCQESGMSQESRVAWVAHNLIWDFR